MAMRAEPLAGAAFRDPAGPHAARILGLPGSDGDGVDERIRRTWALACTGKFTWPIPDRGLHKRLHRITAPTLVVWGARDGIAPPLYAEEFARRIPGARAEVVEDAAHHPHLERPDAVLPLLREFLMPPSPR
jgi:pimeloyl-ACP methyl ester carboxylesterase